MRRARADFGQISAQIVTCDNLPFAQPAITGDKRGAARINSIHAVSFGKARLCDFFPLNWPSPFGAGSFSQLPMVRGTRARGAKAREKNALHDRRYALESRPITTNDRGKSCENYWHLAYWPCPFQPVWTMTFSAGFWVRVWAQRLHIPRADQLVRGPSWAALRERCATTLTLAGRVTNSALTFGSNVTEWPSGQCARLAIFHFAPRALARSWPNRLFAKELAHV